MRATLRRLCRLTRHPMPPRGSIRVCACQESLWVNGDDPDILLKLYAAALREEHPLIKKGLLVCAQMIEEGQP